MNCINCGRISERYEECYICYKIRSGMKHKHFYTMCARICTTFPVYRQRKKFYFSRPVSHPLCKNNTCASEKEKYKNLRDHQKKDVYIDHNLYIKMIHKPCIYCGFFKAGGIDRIDSKRGYKSDNIVPCCAQCNYMKGDLNLFEFLKQVCRVYTTQEKKNVYK